MADRHRATPRRTLESRWRLRYALGLSLLIAGASAAEPVAAPGFAALAARTREEPADFSVTTYNVKGLPWPIAEGRPDALRRIGARLAQMRAAGRQPQVVVLQEAFTPEAKAIGDRAGYPYQVEGPYLRSAPGERRETGGVWYLGETGGSALDSGLVVLSDFPVTAVARAAFPTGACAGYDCLAAKGVVMVTLDVPGRGPVTVAATHLNSRGASGAPPARTHAAYRRQTAFLAEFLARNRVGGEPVILAGDFNRGDRPVRIAALAAAFGSAREGLSETLRDAAAPAPDAKLIQRRGRDMQLLFDGTATHLETAGADVPFGTERNGTMLSDHLGFTVRYRLVPRT